MTEFESTSFPTSAAPIWKRLILLIAVIGAIVGYLYYERSLEEEHAEETIEIEVPFEEPETGDPFLREEAARKALEKAVANKDAEDSQ